MVRPMWDFSRLKFTGISRAALLTRIITTLFAALPHINSASSPSSALFGQYRLPTKLGGLRGEWMHLKNRERFSFRRIDDGILFPVSVFWKRPSSETRSISTPATKLGWWTNMNASTEDKARADVQVQGAVGIGKV
ncbi:hypothetical protein B0I35DRAFT_250759 [Stachybotrys elegans]|uniref:Uncharacterized protein n=1 Tax=Stachybotrys elegans TaxID=80388 RepID=A0A8K0WR19_9HYPO|nr:hypothetical protein B0I35DRAFT_250759 [Stachybotrys elegans]